MIADAIVKVPCRGTATGATSTLAKKDLGGPVGKANKDNTVFCAIDYTITKVSVSEGASVNAVTVKCPFPPFIA